jgi:hypothetical protein
LARELVQATQVAPSGAQAFTLSDVHVFPVQQPPGHEVALQTQFPPTHR